MHQFENFEFINANSRSLLVPATAIVRVQSGRLWLTVQGRMEDIWLDVGDQWSAPATARVHLSAEPQACFALGRPVARGGIRKQLFEWIAPAQMSVA